MVGQTIYDLCTKKTFDAIRNKWYPAWKTRNENDKLESRILDVDALPVLFTIKIGGAGAQELQANMITRARLNFERRKIFTLIDEDEVADELQKRYGFHVLKSSNEQSDRELAQRLILPYIQTTKLMDECRNTQVIKTPSGGLRIEEKTGRKDRVMSMLYGLYFIDLLEQDLQEVDTSFDWTKIIKTTNGASKTGSSFFSGGFSGFNKNGSNPFRR